MISSMSGRQLPLRLREESYAELKMLSFLTGTSMNALVNEALTTWLATVGRERLAEASASDARNRFRRVLHDLEDR